MQEYKAVIKQEGKWWYGWIEEMPGVNCQEQSKEELLETLQVTLREAIEFNREEARKSASGEFTEVRIAI
jgi:predicted RNase H-like HicB family nuclease